LIGINRYLGLDSSIPLVYTINMTPEYLKEWRSKNGFTQSGLAKRLNVATMTVSRWETGLRAIPPFLSLALQAIKCETKKERRIKWVASIQEVTSIGSSIRTTENP